MYIAKPNQSRCSIHVFHGGDWAPESPKSTVLLFCLYRNPSPGGTCGHRPPHVRMAPQRARRSGRPEEPY